jgi:hypothetical protein
MTLVGINWFAVAIAVAANMLYTQFRYIPRLEKLDEKKLHPEISFVGLVTAFLSSIGLAIVVWNLLLIPQITYYWLILGIAFPFFALPHFTTLAIRGRDDKLNEYERDRVIFEFLSIIVILSVVLGKI